MYCAAELSFFFTILSSILATVMHARSWLAICGACRVACRGSGASEVRIITGFCCAFVSVCTSLLVCVGYGGCARGFVVRVSMGVSVGVVQAWVLKGGECGCAASVHS